VASEAWGANLGGRKGFSLSSLEKDRGEKKLQVAAFVGTNVVWKVPHVPDKKIRETVPW